MRYYTPSGVAWVASIRGCLEPCGKNVLAAKKTSSHHIPHIAIYIRLFIVTSFFPFSLEIVPPPSLHPGQLPTLRHCTHPYEQCSSVIDPRLFPVTTAVLVMTLVRHIIQFFCGPRKNVIMRFYCTWRDLDRMFCPSCDMHANGFHFDTLLPALSAWESCLSVIDSVMFTYENSSLVGLFLLLRQDKVFAMFSLRRVWVLAWSLIWFQLNWFIRRICDLQLLFVLCLQTCRYLKGLLSHAQGYGEMITC